MFTLKYWLIFLAGAAFFHTISHLILPYYIELPFHLKDFTLTKQLNDWAIWGSAALTIILLWLAGKVRA